jgi:translation initiation factor eIF-2B subunit alpha
MKQKDKENLYRLFRHHGNIMGTARATLMSLNAFIEALRELSCDKCDFVGLYQELADTIKNTEPKIIPLIHLLEQFEEEMTEHVDESLEIIRTQAIHILEAKIDLIQSKMNRVTEKGLNYVANDDVIIVHMASGVVTSILTQARAMGRRFRVTALELDPVRTRQLTNALTEAGIEHRVAPAHNLSHYVEEANKIFIGAVTVTADDKIVVPVGTANALSLCNAKGIVSYLFANTLHYSHGLSSAQRIHCEETDMVQDRFSYKVTTHSHDLVDLDMIDHIINEHGLVDRQVNPG